MNRSFKRLCLEFFLLQALLVRDKAGGHCGQVFLGFEWLSLRLIWLKDG